MEINSPKASILLCRLGVSIVPGAMALERIPVPTKSAAIDFVKNSEKEGVWAAIGDLKDTAAIIAGKEGTVVKDDVKDGVVWRPGRTGPKRKESRDPPARA